jgi:hypothetical protein
MAVLVPEKVGSINVYSTAGTENEKLFNRCPSRRALLRAETGPRFKSDGAPNLTIGGTIQFLFP